MLGGPHSSQLAEQLCIVLWIFRGSSESKLMFMNKLVSSEVVGGKVPILCNQDNFILKLNPYKLFQAIPGFQFFVNPAVKNIPDRGRTANGMFICVPDSIKSSVTDISPGH